MINNKDTLDLAWKLLDRVAADYPTMFDNADEPKHFGYDASIRTCPTRVKEELRLIRRLLLEVEKSL